MAMWRLPDGALGMREREVQGWAYTGHCLGTWEGIEFLGLRRAQRGVYRFLFDQPITLTGESMWIDFSPGGPTPLLVVTLSGPDAMRTLRVSGTFRRIVVRPARSREPHRPHSRVGPRQPVACEHGDWDDD